MSGKKIAKIIISISLIFRAGSLLAAQSVPLTLPQAERLAIASAPELQRLQDERKSLEQQAIANGQLPDPKLMAGTINVPTNTFSFNQDDMTMIQVGLEQSFPPGKTLAIKSKQTRALATVEKRKIQAEVVTLLKNVRETWLDLYYFRQAARIVRENRALLTYLLKTTKSQYSVGKDNLSNVLQIQLERSRLNDQSDQIQQKIDTLRAALARFIGQNQANRPLANTLPHWSKPPSLDFMQTQLQQHPLLKVDAATVKAARDEVALAREQFKPGFTVDLDYGIRQGNTMMGTSGISTSRSDMVTAQVSMDLPFFTKNRQSRRLKASSYQLEAAELERQVQYRDLLKTLREQYAMWTRLSQRKNLYAERLIPEARQNAKAALLAYKSATADLATVLRAYTNEKNIELEQLQIQVEREKVRASLLYLQGLSQ